MVKFRALGYNRIKEDERFLREPLHRWLAFFDKNSPKELIEEIVKMDAAIRKAHERTAFVTQDEIALTEYIRREIALSDWTSAVNYHKRKGANERDREIAQKLKALGVPIDTIIESTGLTEKQINEL